jgi:hypothetical protein
MPVPTSSPSASRGAPDLEAALLVHCARGTVDPERAAAIRALAGGDLRWDRLQALADRHGLGPLLFWHLSQVCPASVPVARLTAQRALFQKQSAFSLLFTGELLRVIGALRDHGVEAMPFKGPALALKLYGHVALRRFGDLDILVRQRDAWRACDVLEAQGFEPDLRIPAARRAAFVREDYVRSFHRDVGRTIVELHWGIARRSFAVRYDSDAVWRGLSPMLLHGRPVLMPADEDLLVMLCVHGARHCWDKLEGVASVAQLIRANPGLDWASIWRTSAAMHCRRMVAFGVRLAHDLFETPLPADAAALSATPALREMAGAVVRRAFADDPQLTAGMRQAAFYLRLKDTYADRARSCARVFLTPTPDDWASVDLRGPLALAYPLVRAARVARKHVLPAH